MKMMLSMPRTISSVVNVSSPSHASGLVSQSMVILVMGSRLERNGEAHLGSPLHADERAHFGSAIGRGGHARGNQRVDGADEVIREQQADLALRLPEGVVAA